MATETAKFALALDDGISTSAADAEDALKKLQAQIDRDSKALTQMKAAMRQMQAAGSVDIDAYRKLKAEIDATQDSIGKARAAFINLGGEFGRAARKAPKNLDDMLSASHALPGPLGRVTSSLSNVKSMVTGLAAAVGVAGAVVLGLIVAFVALVAVLAAVAVATVKLTTELLRYAVAQADAMRSERLRLEGLGTLRRWMRLTATDSAQMSESINRVAERVPLARSEIAGYGQELHRLGIRGRAAEDALEALSIAQAVQGDRGRQRLMMLVRMAGHSERAMANLSARVRKELGGVAAGQMRSLTMISTKLRESFQALFSGVPIERLLSGLYRLSQLLSQNTESGRALRTILSTVLGAFIGELDGAVGPLEYLFKELVIVALKVAIAFFRVRNAIQDAFGPNILGRMLASEGGMEVLRMGLLALTVAAGILVAGIVVLSAMVFGLLFPFLVIAAAIYGLVRAAEWVIDSFARLRESFNPASWLAAGSSMIDGIISGLASGVARLRAAVTGVATNALSAFREALGIHSPSSVFAALGLAIPQGVAEGVERGSPEAAGVAGSMMSTTTNNVTQVRGGSSRAVTTGEIHIHVGQGEGGEDTARAVVDGLRDFFAAGLATETV